MKRKDLLPLKPIIGTVDNADFKLQMKLFKNYQKAKKDVEIATSLHDSFVRNMQKYQDEINALNNKYAQKDKEGKPVIKNGRFQFADQNGRSVELEVINNKYRRWHNINTGIDPEYNDVMNEEVNIVFVKLTTEEAKQLTGNQLVALKHMLPKKLKASDLNEDVKASQLIELSELVEIV